MAKSLLGKRLFLIIISSLLIGLVSGAGCSAGNTTPETSAASGDIITKFKNPDVDARVMARNWFPDGGAGADEEGLALVAKQVNDLARGGFGGVEIAFLSDSTSYNNEDARTIGWGSENWQRVLKEALKTANAVEQGFKIDITITSHWPPIVNIIDPNDNEASQEATYAYRKISAEDLAAGVADLPLPEPRTKDYFSPMGGGDDAHADFLFVEKFVAATLAKVASVGANGTPVFELASLTDLSGSTTRKTVSNDAAGSGTPYKEEGGVKYAGHAGGVPDRTYAEAHGLDYEKDVIAKFGPDPISDNFTGKMDADDARRRMADWQYLYQTSLDGLDVLKGYSPANGDTLAPGDYVLIGTYHRGTGQTQSGGTSMTIYNRSYVTDYFSDRGAQKVFEFWDKNILDDEMLALLKENGAKNGTSIFEDSIEIHAEKPLWTYDLLDEFKAYNGYDAAKYAPVLVMGSSRPGGMGGQAAASPSFDDASAANRIKEDYNLLLGHLYAVEHADVISDWAAGFNYTYRAQGYALTGLDIAGAAAALDIPEGDNSSSGDGLRNLVAAVNVKGGKMLSMESTTFSASLTSPWATVIKELNGDFSGGVNRSILHGTPFSRSFNRFNSEWPGWNFWNFSAWNARQIHWDDVDTFSGYVGRTQAVMQNGRAKVDLAVLLGIDSSFNMPGGNSMQSLLDKGYSYNLLSEALLKLDGVGVQNGRLCPTGPAYKAIIVKEAKIMSATAMQRLLEYAQNGLPIIFYNCDIARIYGTNRDDNNDTLLAEKLAELMKMEQVKTASTQDEILSILSGWGVDPAASYTAPGLEASHRAAAEGDYYYFYNNSQSPIETTVTLTGQGAPYRLDAWTGEITPLALYQEDGGRTRINIKLEPREAAIFAMSKGAASFPTMKDVYVTDAGGGDAVYVDHSIVHRAGKPGTYTVSLSDNTKKTVTVDTVPAAVEVLNGWDLSLESWGPDPEANKVDPTLSAKKTITFKDIPLSIWSDLPATKAQIESLGVDAMNHMSGIGTYTTTFTLPTSWNTDTGAILQLTHGADMVVEVLVNNHRIDDVNQLTNKVDVGAYLTTGKNTLMVKLDSTLQHRIDLENPGGSSGPMGAPQGGMPDGSGGINPDAATVGRGGGEAMEGPPGGGMPDGSGGAMPEGDMPPQGGMSEGTRGSGGAMPEVGMPPQSGMSEGTSGMEMPEGGMPGGDMGGMPGGTGGPGGMGGMGSSSSEPEIYGLIAVTLVPYVQTLLVQ